MASMTLEEAIKHCEDKAEELEEAAKEHRLQFDTRETISNCEECAKDHRQLAEWLKCLKEIWDSGCCNDCAFKGQCKYEPMTGQLVRYNCHAYSRKRLS